MSSIDSVFLAIEDAVNTMNIGTVAIFDGPAPPLTEVRAFLARRVASVPRCRQRVREPHGLIGRPVWIDDTRFDLDSHVHAVSLTDPDQDGLDALVAELLVAPLDRGRPLWEVWVVDGLSGDRWAVVAKVHHSMVDGIAGSDLLSAILADQADDSDAVVPDRRTASSETSATAYAWFSVRTGAGSLADRLRGALIVLRHPARSWRWARRVVAAAKELWYRQQHVPTFLVGPIGTGRRWTRCSVPLGTVAEIRAALGGTVNDVVVAAVSIGIRDLLVERGETIANRMITAMVPVSLRVPAMRGETGNRVANVHARLPMDHADPGTMLDAVHEHLEALKRSHEVDATGLLLRVGDYVPRVVADRVARTVVRRQRNVETVITDVPGPRQPLSLAGRRMVEGYPVAPIAGQVRISIAIWSYCDHLYVGITGDRDSVPDLEHLQRGIARGFAALLDAARAA